MSQEGKEMRVISRIEIEYEPRVSLAELMRIRVHCKSAEADKLPASDATFFIPRLAHAVCELLSGRIDVKQEKLSLRQLLDETLSLRRL